MWLIYTLDHIYQKHNPERKNGEFNVFVKIDQKSFFLNCSQDVFDNDITDICAAIFVHNLDKKCFSGKKIDINVKEAKLAFLLKLSDELQDWNRTVFKNNLSNSSELYDINVIDKMLRVKTTGDFGAKISNFLDSHGSIVNDNSSDSYAP